MERSDDELIAEALRAERQAAMHRPLWPGHYAQALAIADAAVIAEVETWTCDVRDECGQVWLDTVELMDPAMSPVEVRTIYASVLEYGLRRALLRQHPMRPRWVRIVR